MDERRGSEIYVDMTAHISSHQNYLSVMPVW